MRSHLEAYVQGYAAAKGQNTDTHNISGISTLIRSIRYPPVYMAGVLGLAVCILVIHMYWKPLMFQTLSWVLRNSREQQTN